MSFVKTLATLAVGFAAARGVEKYREIGGLDGVKDALRKAGEPGGVADRVGGYAEKMGVTGGRDTLRDLFARFGTGAADAAETAEARAARLRETMAAASQAGAQGLGDMLHALTGGIAGHGIAEEQARLMIRAMIQAARADGTVDPDERASILDHLADASDAEIAFVDAEMSRPVDPVALAAEVPAQQAEAVYSAALMAISVDSEPERRFLLQLAAALRLPAATVARIHGDMGKPAA